MKSPSGALDVTLVGWASANKAYKGQVGSSMDFQLSYVQAEFANPIHADLAEAFSSPLHNSCLSSLGV